ncbi:MAG: hypothetical protein HOO67_07635 [Candidatus Peribacteraceae bacterium]|nr:hypothetical protein [Candidatus Peribacteraceae bacterium]
MNRIIPWAALLVAGCSLSVDLPLTGSGSVRDVLHTASGYVMEAGKQAAATIEFGKRGIQKGKETVEELQKRADQVQKGIESVKKGKELIEKGLAK